MKKYKLKNRVYILIIIFALLSIILSMNAAFTFDSSKITDRISQEIMSVRLNNNLTSFEINPNFSILAMAHSVDMIDNKYFAPDRKNQIIVMHSRIKEFKKFLGVPLVPVFLTESELIGALVDKSLPFILNENNTQFGMGVVYKLDKVAITLNFYGINMNESDYEIEYVSPENLSNVLNEFLSGDDNGFHKANCENDTIFCNDTCYDPCQSGTEFKCDDSLGGICVPEGLEYEICNGKYWQICPEDTTFNCDVDLGGVCVKN